MILDAHVHVWDPATRDHAWLDGEHALRRRFSLDDLAAVASANRVDAVVLVQVLADLDETQELLALANAHELVAGVVGWVDLEAPDVADVLASLRESPGGDLLVGVRQLVQSEPDPGYLERASVQRGLRATAEAGLAFDLLVRPHQLGAAVRALGPLGGLRVVLDHGGKPAILGGELEPWWSELGELARLEQVVCKVSGLVSEAGPGWTEELVRPYVERLLERFGPDRLIFGSDWPVCTAVARYEQVLSLAEGVLATLGPGEREAVLSGTARRAYALGAGSVE